MVALGAEIVFLFSVSPNLLLRMLPTKTLLEILRFPETRFLTKIN